MAVSITVTVTTPKRKFGNKKWLDELARVQRQTSVPRLKKLFQKTVFGWSNKPDFGWTQIRTSDTMSIKMYPQGQYADIWNLVNAGAPPHVITPKKQGGFLRFKSGYRPATIPGQLQSRRAYRSGDTVKAYLVNHPGFVARDFPSLIADEYENPFMGDMQQAINTVAKS